MSDCDIEQSKPQTTTAASATAAATTMTELPEIQDIPDAEADEPKPDQNVIRPEIKEALDSFEAFFDEYCDFIQRYEASPNDLALLKEYADYLSQYNDAMSKMDALNDGSLNDAELAYYLEVTARINAKLMNTAF